jgi:asparagine synthase (glutamine-hydrolysing)
MCGIAGVVGAQTGTTAVESMISAMHHRGPDGSGVWVSPSGHTVLGNCRLSIIDLSSAGHMPMSDPSERCCITYNGELYNFRELRRKLAEGGYPFRSTSDTEVVLAAYLRWGRDSLRRLVGMFAFAICDERDSKRPFVLLARDRLGIKPLYWVAVPGGIVFASEVKALLASGQVPRVADRLAIWDYLSLGSVPGPSTIIQGVRSLPPSHSLALDGAKLDFARYWDLPPAASRRSVSPTRAAGELRDLLEQVVEEHMIADVPVGAFLSGGTDSSAIVALAARHSPGPLKTFTIRFGDGHNAADEAHHASIMAKHIGADHTEVFVSGEAVAAHFAQVISAMDQPTIDGVNSWFVSRATRESVTVSLSGLGSDEIFAGYPHFRLLQRAGRLAPHGNPLLMAAGRHTSRLSRHISSRLRFLGGSPAQRYLQVREIFTADDKKTLIAGLSERSTETVLEQIEPPGSDLVGAVSRVELRGYLVNTLLRDADAMSMAHSLEVRVPFVDHRVVEYALSLPGPLKLDRTGGKIVLKRAVADLLPSSLLHRPKSYFSMPLQQWAVGPLLPPIRDSLRSGAINDIFGNGAVRSLERAAAEGEQGRVWAVAILAAWLQAHGVSVCDPG